MADELNEDAELARLDAELAAGGPSPEQIAATKAAADAAAAQASADAAAKAAADQAAADAAAAAAKTPEQIAAEQAAAAAAAAQDDGTPKRVRIEGLSDAGHVAAATTLAKAEGISFSDAWDRVKPQQAKAADAAPDPVVALEKENAEISARLDAAAEDQSLFTPELRKDLARQAEVSELIRQEKAKKDYAAAAQVQTEQQKFDSEWEASEKLVSGTYPKEALVEGSPLNQAVAEELATIGNNPDHRDYGRADLPEMLYAKHASRLGIAPVKKQVAAPVNPRVLPASGGAHVTPPPVHNPGTVEANFVQRQAKAVAEDDAQALYELEEERLTGKAPPKHRQLQVA